MKDNMPPLSSGSRYGSLGQSHGRHVCFWAQLVVATLLLLPTTITASSPLHVAAAPIYPRAPPARNPHVEAVESNDPPSSIVDIVSSTLSSSTTKLSSFSNSKATPTSTLRSKASKPSSLASSTPAMVLAASPPSTSTASPNGISHNQITYALDLQSFSPALAGISAPSIVQSSNSDSPYQVDNETFIDFQSAALFSCTSQYKGCMKLVTSKSPPQNSSIKVNAISLSTSDCEMQKSRCVDAQSSAAFQTFALDDVGVDPLDSEYELLCLP